MKECSTGFYFFEKVQDLPTRGAAAVQHFTINGSLFLTFGNYQGDIQKHRLRGLQDGWTDWKVHIVPDPAN